MIRNIVTNTFEEAFVKLNEQVYTNWEYQNNSRMGKTRELTNCSFEVLDPTTYEFTNSNINRIKYDYANSFYNWMLEGGTTAPEGVTKHLSKEAMAYVLPPTSEELPANFNTLYGPRIVKQLPSLLQELHEKSNTRRAVLLILHESDQIILNLDEKIEYPCCFNATYYIRDGKLNAHVNMRSQNTAVVLQVDIYLHARLMQHILDELSKLGSKYELGKFSYHMVSAHMYERDFDYVKTFLNGKNQ